MDPTTTGLARAAGQDTRTITLNEGDENAKDVTIGKIRAKQFVEVFKKIDELTEAGVVKLTDETGAFIFSAKGIFTQFSEAKLILRGGDPVLDIIAIISKLPRAEVDELDLLDLAKVIGAAWDLNKSFFVRNQTLLKEALGSIWTVAETLISKLEAAATAAKEKAAEGKETTEPTTSTPPESFPASSIG